MIEKRTDTYFACNISISSDSFDKEVILDAIVVSFRTNESIVCVNYDKIKRNRKYF